jgi:hypothetical protein
MEMYSTYYTLLGKNFSASNATFAEHKDLSKTFGAKSLYEPKS